MATFYDEWLATCDRIQEKFKCSPVIARDRDIPWVETVQDKKVKLMLSNELGFPTMGGAILKAEIPVGWHTGRHRHGEESIFIIKGKGFSIVEGKRFDWRKGTTLHIPYRAEHQHVNIGDEPAQYLSAMCFPLEAFLHLAKLEQIEKCGPNNSAILGMAPHGSEYLDKDRRVSIHLDDAPSGTDLAETIPGNTNQHYSRKYLIVPSNGFKAKSVAIARMFEEPAGYHTGRHKHLEAVLYALDGNGCSEVHSNAVNWEPGDVLHVPPAMYEHEHFNQSDNTYRLLQIKFGMRAWFTNIWPEGYTSQRIYDDAGNPIISGRIS
jgi:quercetin dioxygenase-like cupin family protein